jgi:hypothetical protein
MANGSLFGNLPDNRPSLPNHKRQFLPLQQPQPPRSQRTSRPTSLIRHSRMNSHTAMAMSWTFPLEACPANIATRTALNRMSLVSDKAPLGLANRPLRSASRRSGLLYKLQVSDSGRRPSENVHQLLASPRCRCRSASQIFSSGNRLVSVNRAHLLGNPQLALCNRP